METTRDLGQIELWQQSFERSLARRGKLARSSVELHRLVPERDLAAPDLFLESTNYWQARRRAAASHPAVPRPVVALGGVSALTLVSVTTLPTLLGASRHRSGLQAAFAAQLPQATMLGNGQRRSVASIASAPAPIRQAKPKAETVAMQPATTTPVKTTATVAHRAPAPTHAAKPAPKPATVPAKPAKVAAKPTTADHVAKAPKPTVTHPVATPRPKPTTAPKPAAPKPTAPAHKPAPSPKAHKPAPKPPAPRRGYVNPLAHASVTAERIDQGVDYAGTGTLTAIGRARITYAATTGTGWPGAFIEYRLLNGPDAGRYVYYAEGVRPASGISVGRIVGAGQPVAHLIPGWSTGIEIGWGAGIGTETYAAEHGQHTFPTPAGKNFSALIASLGGPPGR